MLYYLMHEVDGNAFDPYEAAPAPTVQYAFAKLYPGYRTVPKTD